MENNLTNKLSENYLIQQKVIVLLMHVYVLMNLDMNKQTFMIACTLAIIVSFYKYYTIKIVFDNVKEYEAIKNISKSFKENGIKKYLTKVLLFSSSLITFFTVIKSVESINLFINEYLNLNILMNDYLLYYLALNFSIAVSLMIISARRLFLLKKGV